MIPSSRSLMRQMKIFVALVFRNTGVREEEGPVETGLRWVLRVNKQSGKPSHDCNFIRTLLGGLSSARSDWLPHPAPCTFHPRPYLPGLRRKPTPFVILQP